MVVMKLIKYEDLNSKQKEIYNFQKVAGCLADYGFNCIKLSDDWMGADFLAYHYGGMDTLRVQLKGRLTIDKKYVDKDLYMCFPIDGKWYLVLHDELVEYLEKNTPYLSSSSWIEKGSYSSRNPNKDTIQWLSSYCVG